MSSPARAMRRYDVESMSGSDQSSEEEASMAATLIKPTTIALILGVSTIGFVAMFGGTLAGNLQGNQQPDSEAHAKPALGLLSSGASMSPPAPVGRQDSAEVQELGAEMPTGMGALYGPGTSAQAITAGPKPDLGLLQGTPEEQPRGQEENAAVRAAGPPSLQAEESEAEDTEENNPFNPDSLHDGSSQNATLTAAKTNLGAGPDFYRHWALPCWYQCGKAGLCEDYCGAMRSCCQYSDSTDPPECRGVKTWPVSTFHTCVTGRAEEAIHAAQHPDGRGHHHRSAPIHRFYVYRAQSDAQYPFSNVNAGNLPGVMWYLTNEVMALAPCPKRYGIKRILREIITTKATPQLYARGMDFSVRYSYDRGQCTASNTVNLGACDLTWNRFGHTVGCNNFRDHYPWPRSDTNYPDGMWYSLPAEGKCDHPTGGWNCTWSAESAGEISIDEDLETFVPGSNYCCQGQCSNFWQYPHSTESCEGRVTQAEQVFKRKYPHLPETMPPPECNFDRSQFWANWREGTR